MIVYNVGRRWFDKKRDADFYRISQKLKPDACIKVSILHRHELAALLDGLCALETPPAGNGGVMPPAYQPDDPPLVDSMADVPAFIRKDWGYL